MQMQGNHSGAPVATRVTEPHKDGMTPDLKMPARSHLLPALAVSVCGLLWGVFWLPLRWFDSQGMGSAWVALLFNLVAIAAPLPWLLKRTAWADFPNQSLTGLILGTAFALYTVSLAMTDVIHAILLFYLTPVWSTLAGWVLLGERITVTRIIAVILGFAGLWAILGGGGVPLPRNAGDWLALLSGLLWSAGTLRSFARPSQGIALPVFCFAGGGLAASAVLLIIASALSLPMAAVSNLLPVLPWIVLLAIVIFVPPNFLVLWAAQRMDPGRVGILLMTEVLVGSISAGLLAGEAYGASEAIGTALIVTAGLVEVWGRRS
jgi:drug/metabolite transporter (DMT)-like permease